MFRVVTDKCTRIEYLFRSPFDSTPLRPIPFRRSRVTRRFLPRLARFVHRGSDGPSTVAEVRGFLAGFEKDPPRPLRNSADPALPEMRRQCRSNTTR